MFTSRVWSRESLLPVGLPWGTPSGSDRRRVRSPPCGASPRRPSGRKLSLTGAAAGSTSQHLRSVQPISIRHIFNFNLNISRWEPSWCRPGRLCSLTRRLVCPRTTSSRGSSDTPSVTSPSSLTRPEPPAFSGSTSSPSVLSWRDSRQHSLTRSCWTRPAPGARGGRGTAAPPGTWRSGPSTSVSTTSVGWAKQTSYLVDLFPAWPGACVRDETYQINNKCHQRQYTGII